MTEKVGVDILHDTAGRPLSPADERETKNYSAAYPWKGCVFNISIKKKGVKGGGKKERNDQRSAEGPIFGNQAFRVRLREESAEVLPVGWLS